jgi:hypothetical protein
MLAVLGACALLAQYLTCEAPGSGLTIKVAGNKWFISIGTCGEQYRCRTLLYSAS